MRTKLIAIAAGVCATSLLAGLAMGEATEVTVQANRAVETHVGKTATGIPIVNVSLGYGVSYAGLDLASHTGAMQLEKRVSDAAKAACQELTHLYPDAMPDEITCAKAATEKAMVKVHALEAAAAKAK